MPWVHGQDYSKQKNAELRHLLQIRSLPYSGNKTKMVSRLIAHDSEHPFPFQRLPPELRNEIYKLVSVSKDTFRLEHPDHRLIGHTEGINLYNDFLNIQIHSAIFRVSKQTRAEGLALFYQHHHFLLSVEHGGCFLAITKWLRNIGSFCRTNIRYLEIRYRTRSNVHDDASFIGRIGRYLSDKATIIYSTESLLLIRSLWRIRQHLGSKDSSTAPSFSVIGGSYRGVIFEHLDGPSDRPNWQAYASCSWLEGAMTFHPRGRSSVQRSDKGQTQA